MPPIEIGPTRPVGAVQTNIASARAGQPVVPARSQPAAPAVSTASATTAAAATPQVQRSAALSAGAPPVDTDRVSLIRRAIATGTYPIIPTRVADAMIAAGMLLRNQE